MVEQLQMFAPVSDVPKFAQSHTDVRRFIQPKPGPFRKLIHVGAGEAMHVATGPEFRLAELLDGRIVRQFDDGTREPSPVACNRILINDAIRAGQWVEVEP